MRWWVTRLAWATGGGHTTWTCRTCDQTVWGSRADETTPEGCTIVALCEIRDPKLSSFIQTGGPYANRAAGQGACDRPMCVTSEDDDHEVALSAQNRACGRHGASTVLVALAGVGSFLAAVVIGVFTVVGRRDHESRVSGRARRFLAWLREEL